LLWQFEEPRGFLKFLMGKFTSSAATASRFCRGCPKFWWRYCEGNLENECTQNYRMFSFNDLNENKKGL
jgi:hypothetical protein